MVERLPPGCRGATDRAGCEVICGAFMGPGSRAMVALLSSGGAAGPSGLGGLPPVGGAWQPVSSSAGGARTSMPLAPTSERRCRPTAPATHAASRAAERERGSGTGTAPLHGGPVEAGEAAAAPTATEFQIGLLQDAVRQHRSATLDYGAGPGFVYAGSTVASSPAAPQGPACTRAIGSV